VPVPAAARDRPLLWDLDRRELRDYRTRTWSLTHFAGSAGADLGTVRVGAARIENETPLALEDALVRERRGSNGLWVERIPAGAAVSAEPLGADDRSRSELAYSAEGDPRAKLRRALWQWTAENERADVRLVAEFDPRDLPREVATELAGESRGYIVVLSRGEERR
jgi:hypothetical protein